MFKLRGVFNMKTHRDIAVALRHREIAVALHHREIAVALHHRESAVYKKTP